jgi:hypothetical protein
MNITYSRHYYSTPHYASHVPSSTIFGEKPHAAIAQARCAAPRRNHLRDARNTQLYCAAGIHEQGKRDFGKDSAHEARGAFETSRRSHR